MLKLHLVSLVTHAPSILLKSVMSMTPCLNYEKLSKLGHHNMKGDQDQFVTSVGQG